MRSSARPGRPARRAPPAPCAGPRRPRRPPRPARRAPAHHDQVVERLIGAGGESHALGHLEVGGGDQHIPVREHQQGQVGGVGARGLHQRPRLRAGLDVEPAVGHVVARQEVLQLVRLAREAVPHNADAVVADDARLPVREQIVEHRVQLLLRRIPGLHQVVVERHAVDRVDRGLGVGVRGQQHPLRVGHHLARLRGTPRRSSAASAGRPPAAPPARRAGAPGRAARAPAPDSARSTRKRSPYRRRRSRWTARDTPGSSSMLIINGFTAGRRVVGGGGRHRQGVCTPPGRRLPTPC